MPLRLILILGAIAAALASSVVEAQTAGNLHLQVMELARSVDLTRGGQEYLTIVVEINCSDPGRLRRVQPLRADFRVSAGKATLPCRWLRGGSIPEDPRRLRFSLGFSMPPPGLKAVSLHADLPRLESEEILELPLPGLAHGARAEARKGSGWSLTVTQFGEAAYKPPALPPKGQFQAKGGALDVRVFRKGHAAEPALGRAITLAIRSSDVGLYDPILDVSGTLLVDGGPALPLLSALLRRTPARSVEKPKYRPTVEAEFHFQVPVKGRPTGALLRLHRRLPGARSQPLRFDNLPVPAAR